MACRRRAASDWGLTALSCCSPINIRSATLSCSLSCGRARTMLNPELLRRDPDRTRAVLARRDEDAVKAFDEAIVVDEEWRRTTAEVEALRAERKHRSATRR